MAAVSFSIITWTCMYFVGLRYKRQIFSLECASTVAIFLLLRITDNHGVLCVTIFFRNHQVLVSAYLLHTMLFLDHE